MMDRLYLALGVGLVCGIVGVIIQRRRRTTLDRERRRLASLGTVEAHRERRQ